MNKFYLQPDSLNSYAIVFSICFFISLIVIPIVNKLGIFYKILDIPDKRKKHKKPLVRIGGLAIYLSFIFSIIILIIFFKENLFLTINIEKIITIILGSSTFFLIGIMDDLLNLSPFIRLIFQIIVSSFIWSKGIGINNLDISWVGFLNNNIELNTFFSFLISIIWIVGVINAINWIDGLDGLGIGISYMTLCGVFIYSCLISNYSLIFLSIVLLGICLGFYLYNSNPAKLLMGDGGSYLLGSLLAILCLETFKLGSNNENIFLSILFLFVPLADMTYVITKRILTKKSPFFPDRGHIHHRLLNLGISYKNTVIIIIGFQFIFILAALNINKNLINENFNPNIFLLVNFLILLFFNYSGGFLSKIKRL
nr:MraY family glycosyltransferase [Prochlorococcus marinus]